LSLKYHQLSQDVLNAMATGGGGRTALEILRQAQYSKHALLLLGTVMTAETVGHQQAEIARSGYDLLALAQRRDPLRADIVIRHPSVGAWANRTIVALRGGPSLPGAEPGGLATVAAAAAIRVGLVAEIDVPVSGRIVMLPSLGAVGPVDAGLAKVRIGRSYIEVTARDKRVAIPRDYREHAPGWQPLRQICPGSLELLIDDVDPFRMPAALHLTTPPSDLGRWPGIFREAWALLKRHHPTVATEVAALVGVIVPLATPLKGQVSSSSPETFGAIALSEPLDACTLASTLAHEVQHVKLSALLDMVSLIQPDDGRRFYAPWREDPRPATGLLQGAYAYVGVSGFWRRQRALGDGLEAHVEFARWREAAALVAGVLLRSGCLTNVGDTFVRGMAATLRAWQSEPVPETARRRAREKAEEHAARWESKFGPVSVSLSVRSGESRNRSRVGDPQPQRSCQDGHCQACRDTDLSCRQPGAPLPPQCPRHAGPG